MSSRCHPEPGLREPSRGRVQGYGSDQNRGAGTYSAERPVEPHAPLLLRRHDGELFVRDEDGTELDSDGAAATAEMHPGRNHGGKGRAGYSDFAATRVLSLNWAIAANSPSGYFSR